MKKLNVVLVGLGFGGAFVPIYKDHPAVGNIGIFDTDTGRMRNSPGRTAFKGSITALMKYCGIRKWMRFIW